MTTHISCKQVNETEVRKTLVGVGDIGGLSLEAIVKNLWKCYKAKRRDVNLSCANNNRYNSSLT